LTDAVWFAFIFGLLLGALFNSIYRRMRIAAIKEQFERDIEQLEARRSALVAPTLWTNEVSDSVRPAKPAETDERNGAA
jgi:hypothetical protein